MHTENKSVVSNAGVLRVQEKDPGPHLIVVPTSLVTNWSRELRKWCPSLRVVEYHGQGRFEVWRKLKRARFDLPSSFSSGLGSPGG